MQPESRYARRILTHSSLEDIGVVSAFLAIMNYSAKDIQIEFYLRIHFPSLGYCLREEWLGHVVAACLTL